MQRNKDLVYEVYKILEKYTDDTHSLTLQQIVNKLEESKIERHPEVVKRAIHSLKNEYDVDIIITMGRNAAYHIGARYFESTELKLLIDAVNASNFVGENNANRICEKLRKLTSIYEAKKLERNVMGISVSKVDNKKILYIVDALQKAMHSNRQIEFDYYKWNSDRQLEKRHENKYLFNPWTLIWANDRYYLYGYRYRDEEGLVESHFRVDKIDNIVILDTKREGKRLYDKFDATSYVSKRLGMFSGKECNITVKARENCVGAFIDQFGKQIVIQESKETLGEVIISFSAVPSSNLIGWLLGLEGVQIIKPVSLKNKVLKLLEDNLALYK